jgi:hypothetical protein
METKDRLPAADVRTIDDHLSIESPWTEKRRVEHLRPVRGRHHDDPFARVEAVHLGQQLVEGLLPLFVRAERRRHAHLAERIQFVDEDDARRT